MLREFTLPNGVMILFDDRPWAQSTAITVGVSVGSRHSNIAGLVYAAMQMLLQGTLHHTAAEIFTQIEGVGGKLNLSVERDLTLLRCHMPKGEISTAIRILHEMITSPSFTNAGFQAIKNKLLAQILARENNGMQKSLRIAHESCFGNTAFGSSILGDPTQVHQLRLKDLEATLKKALDPLNLVISVVGGFNSTSLLDELTSTFGRLAKTTQNPWLFESVPLSTSKVDQNVNMKIEPDEKTQAHIALGLRSYKITDEHLPALIVATHLLGGTMSSRLFTEIREVRGLAYTTFSEVSSYRDTGYAFLYAGVRPDGVSEAVRVFGEQLKKLATVQIAKTELNQTRAHILGQLRLAYESPAYAANWLARQEIKRGVHFTSTHLIEQIKTVTPSNILEACRESLDFHRSYLALVGAIDPNFQLPAELTKQTTSEG